MHNEMTLTSAEQMQALAHPLRQRVLRLLTDEARTNRQLAQALGESPARLHFHVRELEKAGLIKLVAERPKGGVIEKYYRAAARSYQLGAPLGAPRPTEESLPNATLEAARQELSRATEYYGGSLPETFIAHDQARLSSERLERVREHLAAIYEELRQASENRNPDPLDQVFVFTCLFHPIPQRRDDSMVSIAEHKPTPQLAATSVALSSSAKSE